MGESSLSITGIWRESSGGNPGGDGSGVPDVREEAEGTGLV